MQLEKINKIAYLLVLIGGVNWLLIGLLNFNLVGAIFGFIPLLARIIYIAVGVAAVYLIYNGWKTKTLW